MSSTTVLTETGLYLYGITLAPDRATGPVQGIGGADVQLIAEDRLAAIVSRLDAGKLRPQRAHLSAHHRVLRDFAERQPVLPVVFGTLSGCEADLREILNANRDALARLLERLRGKTEMGLKVYWDLPDIFEYFVATNQELEHMRDRLFRPGRTCTLEEKVELGKRFERLLQQARQRHQAAVKRAIADCCAELRSTDPGEERMIMKLACLVERDRQQDWEDGVRQAARQFDDHYRFEYSGPWPPYSFADIDLKLG